MLQPDHHLWSSPPIRSNKLALNINLWSSFFISIMYPLMKLNQWLTECYKMLTIPTPILAKTKWGEKSIADQEVNWRWGRREHTGNPRHLSWKHEPQRKRKPHPRGGLQSSSKVWAGAQAKGQAGALLRQRDEVSLQWDYQVSQGGGSSMGTLHSISLAEQSVTSLCEIRCGFQ